MALPVTYTTAEVAAAFRVSVDHLRDVVKSGRVTPLRLSDSPFAQMRWRDCDVEALERALKPPAPIRKRRRKRTP